MGRKFPSEVAERRRLKRSEKQRLEAYIDDLVNDPEFVAQVEEINRQIEDGTFDPGPGLDIEELRRRYG